MTTACLACWKVPIVCLLVLLTPYGALGECINACSGNGDCKPKDMCECYKNYVGNDCSERVCPFGIAYVDTPLGDLNYDDSVGTTLVLAGSAKYPSGVYEQFPMDMVDNEGHMYTECSGKGTCDIETGICQCFDGFEGVACSRAMCPNDCSGHGTCHTIKEFGLMDWTDHNAYHGLGTAEYNLWDANITMGCKCDPGFVEADCSSRQCPYGIDPRHSSYSNGKVMIELDDIGGSSPGIISGTFDVSWWTHSSSPTVYTASGITAAQYTAATEQELEAQLTNKLMAAVDGSANTINSYDLGLVSVEASASTNGYGIRYWITFSNSPGSLKNLYISNAGSLVAPDTIGSEVLYEPVWCETSSSVVESVKVLLSSSADDLGGTYKLKAYDVTGEDHITGDITAAKMSSAADAAVNCNYLISAFTSLPHGLVRDLECSAAVGTGDYANGGIYTLKFFRNAGVVKTIEVFSTALSTTNNEVVIGITPSSAEFQDRFTHKVVDSSNGELYVAQALNAATTITLDGSATLVSLQQLTAPFLVKLFGQHLVASAVSETTVTLAWVRTGFEVTSTAQNAMLFYSKDTLTSVGATVTWAVGATSFTPSADLSGSLSQGDVFVTEHQRFTVQSVSSASPYTVATDKPFGGLADGTGAASALATSLYKVTATDDSAYAYQTPCASRGVCNPRSGTCSCFVGYSGQGCETQLAVVA